MAKGIALWIAVLTLAAQTASADCYKLYADASNPQPVQLGQVASGLVYAGVVMDVLGTFVATGAPCGSERGSYGKHCRNVGVGIAFAGIGIGGTGIILSNQAADDDARNRAKAPDFQFGAEAIREATQIESSTPTQDPSPTVNYALAEIRDLAVNQSPMLDAKDFTMQLAADAAHDLDHSNALCPKGVLFNKQLFKMIVAAEIRKRVKDKAGLGD